jgi:hypothetical protein
MSDLICGREFQTVAPGKEGPQRDVNRPPVRRFLVDGITHPKGEPIRFKSREKAERHIRNMGLAISEAA